MTIDVTHRRSPARTDLHVRRAPVRATSFDPESGSFSAVIATGTPVQRRDSTYGDYFEVLSIAPQSIRLERLKSGAAPLLDSHRSGSAKDQIGIITDARIENGELVADARLSPRDDVKPIAIDLAAGTAPAVSVGYRVFASVESRDESGNVVITHTDWQPMEVSLVAIPADPKAHVRNLSKGNNAMKNQNANDQNANQPDDTVIVTRSQNDSPANERRSIEFYELAARHHLPAEFAQGHIRSGSTVEQFRVAVLDQMAHSAARIQISSRTGGDGDTLDNPDFLARAIEGALYARMTGGRPEGAAAELMGKTVLELGAMMLEQRGERPNWKNREQLAGQIMARSGGMLATTDFPNLLLSTGNRVLNQAYQVAQTPLLRIAKRRDAADFRTLYQIKLSEAPRLLELGEGSEVKHGARSESVESFKLKTYARMFSISRQAIINDDLNAFADSNAAFGRAAAQTEADLLVSLFTANGGNGVNLADGSPLYGTGASRANKAAAGSGIDVTGLSAGRQALRNMKDIDGATPIKSTPRHLVVGPSLETTAEQFLHTISAVDSTKVNPFAGALELHVEPRFADNSWRLFADPAEVPTIMVAYLNGADGPMVEVRPGWDVLGVEVRAVLDFGCGINDFRGSYLNPGT
ncbi:MULTISPECIES: prohead protease/major capsid protein fusion protein [unclassified Bradyrhizobium]|uniref:prohead protease/major capsid protein fusion protein n=1 Tax=unclassified Bradyrhizobium TaxID=2631580 RepID=UPI0029168A01|nr:MULTISPECIES: prohead protease/major capsid protein fusion protein [unclassified Bradyrhizobium]